MATPTEPNETPHAETPRAETRPAEEPQVAEVPRAAGTPPVAEPTPSADPAPSADPTLSAAPAAGASRARVRKNSRNWFIVGAIGLFVVLLCCAGVIVGGMVLLNRETPERVVDGYLSAVRQHDRPRAEKLLCDGLRRGAAGRLTGLAQDWMEVVDWDINRVRDGERSAEVSARVTVKLSGVATTVPFRFILTREDGDWRICGFGSNGINLNPQPTQ